MNIFRKIVKSYSTRLTLIIVVTVLFLYQIHFHLWRTFQQKNLEKMIILSTSKTAEFVEKSLQIFMQQNDRENLFQALSILSEEQEIERIDLLNEEGRVVFSTSKADDLSQYKNICSQCHGDPTKEIMTRHDKISFIRTSMDGGERVIQVINPIESHSSCYSVQCHQSNKVGECLGILSITVSLRDVDAQLAKINSRMLFFFFILLFSSIPIFLIIIYFTTYKPLKKLARGIQTVSSGDLEHTIAIDRDDEFGMVARSFNHMMEKLRQAYLEIQEWNLTLEQKVEEKTSELEKINKEILKIEKLASLGKLSATVAHELNNPLSGIVTYAKLIKKHVNDLLTANNEKERVERQLDIIIREAMRCGNIVKNLLIFARDNSYNPVQCSMDQILRELAETMEHQLSLNKIRFSYTIEPNAHQILADYEQLKQAMMALIINAMEAMPEGGEIQIRAWKNDSQYMITIKDTGSGIPEDVLPHIFDPFFSTKNKTQGVGLGLSVVYGIIKKHQGSIQVNSSPGAGTTFFISLPCMKQEQTTDGY